MGRPGEGSGDGRARTRRRSLGLLDMFAPTPSGVARDIVTARLAVHRRNGVWELRAEKELSGQFSVLPSGPLEPQVVITRIAVRHDHHLAPNLLERNPVVVKEEPDDDHHHNPAVNVEPPADDHEEDEKSEDLAGKMSTIWRPNLGRCASVAEMEGSESEEEEKDATKKGTKRKRAYTKGP